MKKIVFIISVFFLAFTVENLRPTYIFMVGDSTMADKPDKDIPETGWGQVLHYFFNDLVLIENHAVNGRSTKSFIDEGRWNKVISNVKEGDYVIIQFGHNDSKSLDTSRYTSPFTTFRKNLYKFINETQEKGGIPILCSPIIRRHFNTDGTLENTHGDYPTAVRKVAEESGVYFIDMEAKTRKLVEAMGPEKSQQLFVIFESGIYPLRPTGVIDNSHLSRLGAFTVSGLAVEGMKELDIPVKRYLVRKAG